MPRSPWPDCSPRAARNGRGMDRSAPFREPRASHRRRRRRDAPTNDVRERDDTTPRSIRQRRPVVFSPAPRTRLTLNQPSSIDKRAQGLLLDSGGPGPDSNDARCSPEPAGYGDGCCRRPGVPSRWPPCCCRSRWPAATSSSNGAASCRSPPNWANNSGSMRCVACFLCE